MVILLSAVFSETSIGSLILKINEEEIESVSQGEVFKKDILKNNKVKNEFASIYIFFIEIKLNKKEPIIVYFNEFQSMIDAMEIIYSEMKCQPNTLYTK